MVHLDSSQNKQKLRRTQRQCDSDKYPADAYKFEICNIYIYTIIYMFYILLYYIIIMLQLMTQRASSPPS